MDALPHFVLLASFNVIGFMMFMLLFYLFYIFSRVLPYEGICPSSNWYGCLTMRIFSNLYFGVIALL